MPSDILSMHQVNKKFVILLIVVFCLVSGSSVLALFLNMLLFGIMLVLASVGIIMVAVILIIFPLLKFFSR